jgi:hypothetical protein
MAKISGAIAIEHIFCVIVKYNGGPADLAVGITGFAAVGKTEVVICKALRFGHYALDIDGRLRHYSDIKRGIAFLSIGQGQFKLDLLEAGSCKLKIGIALGVVGTFPVEIPLEITCSVRIAFKEDGLIDACRP